MSPSSSFLSILSYEGKTPFNFDEINFTIINMRLEVMDRSRETRYFWTLDVCFHYLKVFFT
jgi:hypothetical protein